MYESFFQLQARPFAAAPQVDRYFPSRAIESARQTLVRLIDRAEGTGLLIGPAGTGKSLVLQVLAEQFRDRFSVALLTTGHMTTRRALLQAISFELGLPYRGLEEGELRLSLIDYLAPGARSANGMLLLLDEAHRLPLRLMEEVRMITNLVRNGQPRVRLVLAGAAVLEERLARPELESFSQRLSARCYLESLDRGETASYVRSQIAGLGGNPDSVFTADALESIYHATGGIPRLINQVCDHALLLAFAGGHRQLDKAGVAEAWADLQQLPTPWNESALEPAASEGNPATNRGENVVEFGQLADAPLAERADVEQSMAAVESTSVIAAEELELDLDTGLAASLRLDTISMQLAELDDDGCQPSEVFGHVITAAMAVPGNPFAESFAEEEVIVDRYATADALRTQPLVRSAEGKRLSAMLAPYVQPQPKFTLASPPPDGDDDELPSGPELEVHSSAAPIVTAHDHQPPDEAPDPVFPEEPWEYEEPPVEDGVPVGGHGSPIIAVDEEEPLIVVEDDPRMPRPTRVQPAAKRQEYRQLFARLRRS